MRGVTALATVALASALNCAQQSAPRFDSPAASDLSCRQQLPEDSPRVVWVIAAAAADGDRLSRWCRTVGPVVYVPRPAQAPDEVTEQLAIVSWNIHEGGGDVRDLARRLRAGEFTGGTPMRDVVLLLQEATRQSATVPDRVARGSPVPRRIAPSEGTRNGDVQRLVEHGFAVLYAPSMRNGEPPPGATGKAEDRGNAIVSTRPLHDPRLIELPLERQRRVAAAAAIEGRDASGRRWRIDLIDVHLDTSLAWLHGGPFAARRRQVRALLDALGDPQPAADMAFTILGGDLNSWRGSREPAVRILAEAFPDTPATGDAPTWRGPLGVHAALDHIFLRGPLTHAAVIRLPDRFGSDHYPLLTVVRLPLH